MIFSAVVVVVVVVVVAAAADDDDDDYYYYYGHIYDSNDRPICFAVVVSFFFSTT